MIEFYGFSFFMLIFEKNTELHNNNVKRKNSQKT